MLREKVNRLVVQPSKSTYLFAENLIDGCALLERRFGDHIGTHLLHVDHEGVQRLLYVPVLGSC